MFCSAVLLIEKSSTDEIEGNIQVTDDYKTISDKFISFITIRKTLCLQKLGLELGFNYDNTTNMCMCLCVSACVCAGIYHFVRTKC